MHMLDPLFSSGNLEQSSASGQWKPSFDMIGWQRFFTDSQSVRHGPISTGTLSVHMGAYTVHRKNVSRLEHLYWISGEKDSVSRSASWMSVPAMFGIRVRL